MELIAADLEWHHPVGSVCGDECAWRVFNVSYQLLQNISGLPAW
jgi:hypothetical protein